MRQTGPIRAGFAFPRPRGATLGMMIAIGCAWVILAVGVNWGGVGESVFGWLTGSPSQVLGGQVQRLLTPILLHQPSGNGAIGHIITTLLGLWFLGPDLEDRWGSKRMLAFLLASAAFGYAVQVLVGLAIPQLAAPMFYGGLGMVEAVAIAWAVQNRGKTIMLFMVLPVTGVMLIGFVMLMSVLYIIAGTPPHEGYITPFGGMLAGYLFCDASPLRRYYLKLKLRRIQASTAAMRKRPRGAGGPALRVIHGSKAAPKDKSSLN